jgi:hypothetical protein
MSSLIVLCPHCLTWVGTHVDHCTECGVTVNDEDDDPSIDLLTERLGTWLVELGPVKLARRGWPGRGSLVATTEGLLFVPEFTTQPNGALEAVAEEPPVGATRVAHLFHWWSLPPWRRPIVDETQTPPQSRFDPIRPPVDVIFDTPGALFVQRTAIKRISLQWGKAQIERRPSRSVTFASLSNGPSMRSMLRRLIDFPPWRPLVGGL